MSKINMRINKTKKGNEFIGIDYFDKNGKRIRKSLGIPPTKENINKVKNHLIPKLTLALEDKSSEYFKNTMLTVDEFMTTSIEMHKSSRNEETTAEYYSVYNNHIKDVFGYKKINDIKISQLAQWQTDLITVKKLSPSRVKTIRKVMSRMFEDAINDEIIDKNPLSKIKSPKINPTDIKPFNLEQIKELIDNAEGQFKNFLATAFLTGARSGELLGLKWEDINFEKKEISINRSIKMGTIRFPKTKNSKRTIDLLDMLIPYLKEQFKLTGKINEYVFINKQNKHYYDIKRLRTTFWKKLLDKCDMEYRPIYYTRHSFATLMIENEDILWVSSMLGHINSTTTLSRYAKYMKKPNIKRCKFLSNQF